MWQFLGQFILKYRLLLLLILLALTSFMAYHASKVELSYEFARAIPTITLSTKPTRNSEKNLEKMATFLL
jgi:hypothetical protein